MSPSVINLVHKSVFITDKSSRYEQIWWQTHTFCIVFYSCSMSGFMRPLRMHVEPPASLNIALDLNDKDGDTFTDLWGADKDGGLTQMTTACMRWSSNFPIQREHRHSISFFAFAGLPIELWTPISQAESVSPGSWSTMAVKSIRGLISRSFAMGEEAVARHCLFPRRCHNDWALSSSAVFSFRAFFPSK